MKKSTTRRALFMSFVSMFLCFTMLVGTTYAWFTDEVTSGVNQIVAGNLDIELNYYKNGAWTEVTENTEDIFGTANWEPGHTEVAYLKVTNAGDLAFKYSLALNIFGETKGLTKGGDEIQLSKYLKFAIIDKIDGADVVGGDFTTDAAGRAAALAAAEAATSYPLTNMLDTNLTSTARHEATMTAKNEEKTVAVVVWMPTTVGNEANHDGENVPTIDLGISVVATQLEAENDSFGPDYDEEAEMPFVANGTAAYDGALVQVDLKNYLGSKVGSVTFPAESVADGVDSITVRVKETTADPNVTVAADQSATTYEITVEGLKSGNTAPVKVDLTIDAGLTGVQLYHEDQPITCSYNGSTGKLIFETTSFSPYTITYDTESNYQLPVINGDQLTPATVTDADEFENTTITWSDKLSIKPSNENQVLESVYLFKAPHDADTIGECAYKDWYCDYYVMMDREVKEGAVVLAGNYGNWGWIGFDSPAVAGNTEVPLLGSVTENPWTYESIVNFVGEFTCGVAHTDASLNGATFTVMLRLTNPENPNEYYNVNTIAYTFDETPEAAVVTE